MRFDPTKELKLSGVELAISVSPEHAELLYFILDELPNEGFDGFIDGTTVYVHFPAGMQLNKAALKLISENVERLRKVLNKAIDRYIKYREIEDLRAVPVRIALSDIPGVFE